MLGEKNESKVCHQSFKHNNDYFVNCTLFRLVINNIYILRKHQRATEDYSNTLSFLRLNNFKGFYRCDITS